MLRLGTHRLLVRDFRLQVRQPRIGLRQQTAGLPLIRIEPVTARLLIHLLSLERIDRLSQLQDLIGELLILCLRRSGQLVRPVCRLLESVLTLHVAVLLTRNLIANDIAQSRPAGAGSQRGHVIMAHRSAKDRSENSACSRPLRTRGLRIRSA